MDESTRNTLQQTATHCDTLQHTATHYNILQHPAPRCNTRASLSSPLRIDSHANEARNQPTHTATLCNTLQHTSLLVVALAY
mmetsp:Transcript_37512/g.55085  ORF Transcript_37512/g.55085 Transcript_37512/m.55085 type:complete len:82 (-) Transcript_37512:616-861(-)